MQSDITHLLKDISILAIASEAGSAKAMISVLSEAAFRGAVIHAWLPSQAIYLMQQYGQKSPDLHLHEWESSYTEEILIPTCDFLMVGTTALDSLERRLTLKAKALGIPSLSIVDGPYDMARRYSHASDDLHYLTDAIALMDEASLQIAIREALPEKKLHVIGNTLLSFLAHKIAPRLKKQKNDIKNDIKNVVFISETFKRDNGDTPNTTGRLQSYLGFTEDSVREDIIQILQNYSEPILLTEILHPSDTKKPEIREINSKLRLEQLYATDLWKTLFSADLVIGMRSLALLESLLLGCRTISYQPNLIGPNECAATNYGFIPHVDSKNELESRILHAFATREAPLIMDTCDFINENSTGLAINLICQLLRQKASI